MSAPALSVVIPAYNEAHRLPATLERIDAFLAARGAGYEIVVVDDGSSDDTADAAEAALQGRAVVLRGGRNRGKGHAVRRGMLRARGARRLMSDADLSTPIEELDKLTRCLDRGDDIAVASRALDDSSIEVRQASYREGVGRLFNRLVQALAVPGIRDTQCGFKLFTARAADVVFGASRLDGFAFDVEALYLARKAGLRISEVGVVWRNDAATRVTLLRGLAAFVDVARVVANDKLGRYRAISAAR